MSLLSIKHIFGIETSLPNSIIYLNEHCYLYPSNRHIILYNIEFKCQYLIKYENEFDILECLSVSPNKEYLSIGLNTLDKCRIIIYNINETTKTPVKRKSLSLKQTIRSNHIISLVFSSNSKYLLVLYGAPDYILVCWSIQRFKPIGIISLHIDLSHHPLNLQISFNPIDSSQTLVTGNHIFRQYRFNNGRFSPHDQEKFHQYDSMDITCHCWLNENHVLLGLRNGFMCTINKQGHILQQHNVTRIDESNNLSYGLLNDLSTFRTHSENVININMKNRRNISKMQSVSQLSSTLIFNKRSSSAIDLGQDQQRRRNSSRYSDTSLYDYSSTKQINNHNEVICLLPFARGLFVSTAAGCVFMYERGENSVELTYLRRFILPSSTINEFSHKKIQTNPKRSMKNLFSSRSSFKHERLITNEMIHSLALSPNEETLLVGTNQNHLYEIAFSKMDYTKKEASIFTYALNGGHHGSIIMGRLCIRKPLLFTIGIDRCLKIWNLQTNNEELNHQFDNEPLLLSVHPSGILICISFSNFIRIYGYTIDGLILFKQFEILHTQCIEYSNEGHMLAIAYDNILQFYHHNDYDQVTNGRINEKKFRLIRWTHDDTFVLSIDLSDLIIQWNPYTGQRLSEYRIVDFSVQDLVLTSDNKLAYLLGSDNKMKEFLMMTNIRDINIPFDDCIPTTLAINEKTRNLFVGSQNGSIYSFKLTQTNLIVDTKQLVQTNVHQGPINQILISSSNDLILSMGDDGNVIIYNLNSYQLNKESKMIFREEILGKEILLKQQNIELNNLMSRQIEITNEYENKIEIKEKEYFQHLHQLDLHCQAFINEIKTKLTNLNQQKSSANNEHQQQLKQLNREKQNSMNQYIEQKNEHYQQILHRDQFIKSQIENFKKDKNQQIELTNDLYQRNVELIHLSYRDKLNYIKNKFFQERRDINERINHLEELKDGCNENAEIELRNFHEYYATQLRTIGDKIETFENEEVLLKTRVEQLEEESNRYENRIKEFTTERNELINSIRQIDNDLNLAKQTFQQRHFIIQEKLERTNEMENRRDELEKFAYVFNYKIRELTSQIGPRQYEVQALIEQFNNMDNEYDLLSQNNEKYSIKIADYKARLRAIEKDFQKETFLIRKFNETSANIKEDLKLCCHLIDQPKQLPKIIRKIYEKYILDIHTNMNFGQMNISDCDRQRAYFERTNQRLQTKISLDIKKEKMEEIHRIKEQISLMREISSYSLKVIEVERILSDLDIVSTIATQMNATTPHEIIDVLKLEQGENLIQEKQIELNSILNKQEKRIEYLRDFISKLDQYLQQKSGQCEIQSIFNSSIDQSRIISSNSILS